MPRKTKPPGNMESVCAALEQRYHSPRHHNKRDPFSELIFIISSLQTTETQYLAAYSRLRAALPKHDDFLSVSHARLASLINGAGLAQQKADCLIGCARMIRARFNRVTLSPLRGMSDEDCEAFLTSLPRIGLKTARCIMMYSLDRAVFPVDTHCWRIGLRLGWVRNTTSDSQPRKREMDRFQAKVPPEHRYSLHVNLVALGRDICRKQKPKCSLCPVRQTCRRIRAGTRWD